MNRPPGNFGRIIAEEGKKHPLCDREQRLRLFEKRDFPQAIEVERDLPYDNIDTAVAYRNSRTPDDLIYEAALINPSAETRLANIFRKACFRRFRRAFETPFNLIPEARLCLRTQRGPVQPEGTRLYIAASGLRLSARMRPPIATKQAPATRSIQ